MKKWVVAIATVVIAVIVWQLWSLYHGIETKHEQVLDEASAKAKKQYHLKRVLHTTYYHGTHAYYVVEAVNQKGKKEYIWLPDGKGKSFVKSANEVWSKEKVQQFVNSHLHPKKLIDIRLGVEENIPIWEIAFIDQKGRYTFYDLRFDGKDWLKNIHL
jgi:uncharacterized protein YpmB